MLVDFGPRSSGRTGKHWSDWSC